MQNIAKTTTTPKDVVPEEEERLLTIIFEKESENDIVPENDIQLELVKEHAKIPDISLTLMSALGLTVPDPCSRMLIGPVIR